MPDPVEPVEAPDPFQGGEPSFEEFSKFRQDGTVPERFKPVTAPEKADEVKDDKKAEAPAQPDKAAEPQTGKEPVTEQEKKEQERDDKGKFAKHVELTPEQQDLFDRRFRQREAKIRRELEAQYSTKTSVPQATAAAEKPTTVETGEPKEPTLPKLSTYPGTTEEFEKEVAEFPAKHQAFLDAKRQHSERVQAIEKKMVTSEAKAKKTHPDYTDEFQSLAADVKSREEPELPAYVIDAIGRDSEDPHEIMYHIATNRDEFRRLAALTPDQALREVLKLDFKLANAPAPVKTKADPKPKPPEPVGARQTSTAFDENDEKTDDETWLKNRWAQVHAKGKRV